MNSTRVVDNATDVARVAQTSSRASTNPLIKMRDKYHIVWSGLDLLLDRQVLLNGYTTTCAYYFCVAGTESTLKSTPEVHGELNVEGG